MRIIKLIDNLTIGQKFSISSILTGGLFFFVIFLYHTSLTQTTTAFITLQETVQEESRHAMMLHRSMLEARRGEKDFFMRLDKKYAERTIQSAGVALTYADWLLQNAEQDHRDMAREITGLLKDYAALFQDIVRAWEVKGLNEKEGLQGKFRQAVHQMEEKSKEFQTGALLIDLLQMRRAEKDLGLRRDEQYVKTVTDLAEKIRKQVTASSLEEHFKKEVGRALDRYLAGFAGYVVLVRQGEDLKDASLGDFRQAAHDIETILNSHALPDLERDVLSLRRREKDYLLRMDLKYVEKLQGEVKAIQSGIAASGLDAGDKKALTDLLYQYEADFLALVAQDQNIKQFSEAMRDKIHKVEPLLEKIVAKAEEDNDQQTALTKEQAESRSRLAMAITLLALLFGGGLTMALVLTIIRPLGRLMGFAQEVARGNLVAELTLQRRDEIGQLADILGRMASDLRSTLGEIADNARVLEQGSSALAAISTQLLSNANVMIDEANATTVEARQMSGNMDSIATASEDADVNLRGIADLVNQSSSRLHAIVSAMSQAAQQVTAITQSVSGATRGMDAVAQASERVNQEASRVAEAIGQVGQAFLQMRQRCQVADQHSRSANDHVRNSVGVMAQLADSAREIHKVVEVINSIAEQTNMLALNAAIEAAGAGEAGKGFAVVANEVKELARQTGEATRMIDTRIQEIQSQVNGVNQASRSVAEIIGKIGDANGQILVAVDEQGTLMTGIGRSMSSVVAEMSATAQRVADSSGSMNIIYSNVIEISQGVDDVTVNAGDVSRGLGDTARLVEDASQGSAEITQNVTEVAGGASRVVKAMEQVDVTSVEIKALSTTVQKQAGEMSAMARDQKQLLDRFNI